MIVISILGCEEMKVYILGNDTVGDYRIPELIDCLVNKLIREGYHTFISNGKTIFENSCINVIEKIKNEFKFIKIFNKQNFAINDIQNEDILIFLQDDLVKQFEKCSFKTINLTEYLK